MGFLSLLEDLLIFEVVKLFEMYLLRDLCYAFYILDKQYPRQYRKEFSELLIYKLVSKHLNQQSILIDSAVSWWEV